MMDYEGILFIGGSHDALSKTTRRTRYKACTGSSSIVLYFLYSPFCTVQKCDPICLLRYLWNLEI